MCFSPISSANRKRSSGWPLRVAAFLSNHSSVAPPVVLFTYSLAKLCAFSFALVILAFSSSIYVLCVSVWRCNPIHTPPPVLIIKNKIPIVIIADFFIIALYHNRGKLSKFGLK